MKELFWKEHNVDFKIVSSDVLWSDNCFTVSKLSLF